MLIALQSGASGAQALIAVEFQFCSLPEHPLWTFSDSPESTFSENGAGSRIGDQMLTDQALNT